MSIFENRILRSNCYLMNTSLINWARPHQLKGQKAPSLVITSNMVPKTQSTYLRNSDDSDDPPSEIENDGNSSSDDGSISSSYSDIDLEE